jgi:hypothetical protein
MNADPENFEDLRRLLKLKRYEQPPPGYFNHFSSTVIARIEAGERGEPDSVMERLFGHAGWWQQLGDSLQSRPGFAGAFGAIACTLLISGIVYSENSPPLVSQAMVPVDASAMLATASSYGTPDSLNAGFVTSSSTNPLAPQAGSLFDQFPLPKSAEPASFSFPGN